MNLQEKRPTSTLREPAQSKARWTFNKSHFMREFRGKKPPTRSRTLTTPGLCHYGKNPQCGHTVRGKKHWILLQYWAPCLIPCGFPSLKGTHWVVGLYNIIAVRPKKQFDFVAVLGSMFSSLWVSQPHGEILGSRLITLHLYPEKSF